MGGGRLRACKQKKAAKLCYSWAGPATVLEVNGSYLKLQTTQWNGHQKVLHLHGAVCRKAQPRDVPQPGSPVYLEPEAVDEYILPPIPIHQPMDIDPEDREGCSSQAEAIGRRQGNAVIADREVRARGQCQSRRVG